MCAHLGDVPRSSFRRARVFFPSHHRPTAANMSFDTLGEPPPLKLSNSTALIDLSLLYNIDNFTPSFRTTAINHTSNLFTSPPRHNSRFQTNHYTNGGSHRVGNVSAAAFWVVEQGSHSKPEVRSTTP